MLGLARKMGVNIYTVALQSKLPRARRDRRRRYFSESDYAMKALARETGAQSFFPAPGELKGVYGSIATELANQYSIGYMPANVRAGRPFPPRGRADREPRRAALRAPAPATRPTASRPPWRDVPAAVR